MEDWITVKDGTKLFIRRWVPDGQVKALFDIVHGMSEHSGRYEELAKKLTGAGFEVWAADARGHGRTADLTINDPGKGGLLGHCSDKGGFGLLVSDMDVIVDSMKKARPGLPLFMLGHSWGSFLVQAYIEAYSDKLSGCILSGTRGPGGVKVDLGAPFMTLIALILGRRRPSKLSHLMAQGPYDKPFRPNRTAHDWLSRDPAKVDAYIADPLCGHLCSAGFYRDLVAGLRNIHNINAVNRIRKDLPIYVFGGNADPVGEMGRSPRLLVNTYRALGIKDLEFVLYPEARHECLNETNREEVMANLLGWLERQMNMKYDYRKES
jgi:alpha-beta hydrolase superfamily lysophospholipase